MLGLDLNETKDVTLVNDTRWTVGLMPLAKYEQIRTELDRINGALLRHQMTHYKTPTGQKLTKDEVDALTNEFAGCVDCARMADEALEGVRPFHRELVRWGLRATSVSIALRSESVKLCGKEYEVLTESTVEGIARIRTFGAQLITRLAAEVLQANEIDASTALGFK